jgi:hypothetical protein
MLADDDGTENDAITTSHKMTALENNLTIMMSLKKQNDESEKKFSPTRIT